MAHPVSPTAAVRSTERPAILDNLTRDQRTVLSRLVQRFREDAAVQVLHGPRESGKSTLAEALAEMFSEEAVSVIVSKGGEENPAQKRLMLEAYGSYSHFLTAILKQLGFFARSKDRDREDDLVVQMVEQLRTIRNEDRRLLLIIDDAQDITPGVWKRFQSWLDYQDRGKRMIQILLVGSPALKQSLADQSMRGWRRWIQGRHELKLLSAGSAGEEIRRVIKSLCEEIDRRAGGKEGVPVPSLSWLAARKIHSEAGGRPGRLTELTKRALTASLREGGCRISRRFLSKTDALRSPTMQMYKLKKLRTQEAPSAAAASAPPTPEPEAPKAKKAKSSGTTPPAHPLGWMRFALGTLLLVFVIGAGWGITAWLSLPAKTGLEGTQEGLVSEIPSESGEEALEPAIEEPAQPEVADSAADPWGDAYSTPVTQAVEDRMLADVSPWESPGVAQAPARMDDLPAETSSGGWQTVDPAPVDAAPVVSQDGFGDPIWGSDEVTGAVPSGEVASQAEGTSKSVDETLAAVEAIGIQMADESAPQVSTTAPAPLAVEQPAVPTENVSEVSAPLPEMQVEGETPPIAAPVTAAAPAPEDKPELAIEGPAPTLEIADSAPIEPAVQQSDSAPTAAQVPIAPAAAAPEPDRPLTHTAPAESQAEEKPRMRKETRDALLKRLDRLEKTLKG
jgi:type II secretory pathway predicted ATPase ExeA